MNKEVLTLWAEALRSGKYSPHGADGTIDNEYAGSLHCGTGFSFDGVLCELHREKNGGEWLPNTLNKHLSYLDHSGCLPPQVLAWVEISTNKPTYKQYLAARKDEEKAIALANPDLAKFVEWMSLANRKSFAEMADIIEEKQALAQQT